jgi:integrase/recombinase XerD
LKVSDHTRRAYAAEADRFRDFVSKPLSLVTLMDVQGYAEALGQGSRKPASQNRALTAVKSLLAFGHETGYLAFNVGAAVKLRPPRDSLAQRILELRESDVAKLIKAAPEGRDCVLVKLLYVAGVRVSEVCGLKWCDAVPRARAGKSSNLSKPRRTRAPRIVTACNRKPPLRPSRTEAGPRIFRVSAGCGTMLVSVACDAWARL